MDIMTDLPERVPGCDKKGLVSALKGTPNQAAKCVVASNPSTLQPLHALAEVRLGGFNCEMKMGAHDRIGVHLPRKAGDGLAQDTLERFGRPSSAEQRAAIVAAVNHVVAGTGKFDPQWPRHNVPPRQRRVSQESRPDVFMTSLVVPQHPLKR